MTSADISVTAVHVDTTAVYVDTMVCNPDLLTRVDISGIVVHGSDTPVKSADVVHGSDMTVKSADVVHGSDMTVKSAVETAAVEAAMSSASVPSARVGKIWLAEDDRAQQRSCNAHDGACLPRSGFVIP
jgi:hypothetical protein